MNVNNTYIDTVIFLTHIFALTALVAALAIGIRLLFAGLGEWRLRATIRRGPVPSSSLLEKEDSGTHLINGRTHA